MKPPIDGMTTRPYGGDYMVAAWLGCLLAAVGTEGAAAAFKAETGHDIRGTLGARGLDKMVDEATGHDRAVVVAFADWVTRECWGEESAETGSAT